VAEQHRGRQADQAAADDQDGDFFGRHGATLPTPRVRIGRSPYAG
jgi:hypothetical protein